MTKISDSDLRRKVIAEFDREQRWPQIGVAVKDRIVTLSHDERGRE